MVWVSDAAHFWGMSRSMSYCPLRVGLFAARAMVALQAVMLKESLLLLVLTERTRKALIAISGRSLLIPAWQSIKWSFRRQGLLHTKL